MIIDIRSHYKKIKKEGSLTKSEIERQVKNTMSYLYLAAKLRKLNPKTVK